MILLKFDRVTPAKTEILTANKSHLTILLIFDEREY